MPYECICGFSSDNYGEFLRHLEECRENPDELDDADL